MLDDESFNAGVALLTLMDGLKSKGFESKVEKVFDSSSTSFWTTLDNYPKEKLGCDAVSFANKVVLKATHVFEKAKHQWLEVMLSLQAAIVQATPTLVPWSKDNAFAGASLFGTRTRTRADACYMRHV